MACHSEGQDDVHVESDIW